MSKDKPETTTVAIEKLAHKELTLIVCPLCGNKRCPHANDHRNDCTNSNDTGQAGSAYE